MDLPRLAQAPASSSLAAPSSMIGSASVRPTAAGSSIVPSSSPRKARPPPGSPMRPLSRRRSFETVASAAIAAWQPPPSRRSNARSALTAARVSGWSTVNTVEKVAASSVLTWTARAPWPGAGSICSKSKICAARFVQPSRASPAAARTTASYSPLSTFRMRVSTFPRISAMRRSPRSTASCAARRGLPVPTMAAAGSAAIWALWRLTRASRASSRASTAAIARPEVSSTGRSFKLCTAISISRSSKARSSSMTNTPRPPISLRDAAERSPAVRIVRTSKAASGTAAWRAARAISVCRSASRLPRVATMRARGDTTSAASRVSPVALRGRQVEQVLERLHIESLVGAVFQPCNRPVEHLLDDRGGHRLDALPRLLIEVGQPRQCALRFRAPDLIGPLPERRDDGHDVERAPPVEKSRHLFFDYRLHTLDFALPAVHPAGCHRFDIVDVEQVDAGYFSNGRVDISRDRDIDE